MRPFVGIFLSLTVMGGALCVVPIHGGPATRRFLRTVGALAALGGGAALYAVWSGALALG